jgi:hypothetical protein
MLGDGTGLNLFLQNLKTEGTYPLELNSLSIGTGTTAPASSDTDLETPVTEGIIRSLATLDSDAELTTEWFIADDELPDGTYNELGLFCTTQIFARMLISPGHSKASGEDTLIVHTITADNTP